MSLCTFKKMKMLVNATYFAVFIVGAELINKYTVVGKLFTVNSDNIGDVFLNVLATIVLLSFTILLGLQLISSSVKPRTRDNNGCSIWNIWC